MKLIKINTDHFVIVDDSEIKVNDWYLVNNNFISNYDGHFSLGIDCRKITHSTQPLEKLTILGTYNGPVWNKVKQISLQEIKELIGEVDLYKAADLFAIRQMDEENPYFNSLRNGYLYGYNQCLEDNKEKKYAEEDLRKAIKMSFDGGTFKEIIQSLQPKTEWEIEFVDDKLILS